MLLAIELITAIFGTILLFREVFKNKFQNYATSIFLICFVPLLCIYPVIARMIIGGAYSVGKFNDTIVPDQSVYLIYQMYCIGTLLCFAVSMPRAVAVEPVPGWERKYVASGPELAALSGISVGGVLLFAYSTGIPIADLIIGSRFGWINTDSYSSVLFVFSTYLLALVPVALFIAMCNPRYRWPLLAGIVAMLILYGLMTKDRRWLMYIMSAGLSYSYVRSGMRISFSRRIIMAGLAASITLAFWQVFREVIFNYYISDKGNLFSDSADVAILLLTRGDFPYYYNASITAIDLNLNYDFSIPLGLIRRELLFFLPADYSFGLKGEDISAVFSDAIGAEDANRRGNMPPGYFGLFCVSFGWFGGVLACSLVPLGVRFLDRVIQRNAGLASIVLLAHMLSAVMLLLRGDDSSAIYFIISSIALTYVARPKFALGVNRLAPVGS